MCENNEINIVYKFQPYNKVNGTLFYCFEYMLQLLELNKDVNFYIFNIQDDQDKWLVEKCFKEKYLNDYHIYLQRVFFLKHTINLAKIAKNKKSVFVSFDIKTYNDYSKFTPTHKKFAYINSNKTEDCYWSNKIEYSQNTTFFGFYYYQIPDQAILNNLKLEFIFEKLQLGLKYHKVFKCSSEHLIFVSAPLMDNISKSYFSYPYITKRTYYCYDNIFKQVDKVIYIHNSFDTNNRIIPESFYQEKKVELINEHDINDSIMHRHELCVNGEINQLILNPDNLMIKNIIQYLEGVNDE